jgi:hypothetical protein
MSRGRLFFYAETHDYTPIQLSTLLRYPPVAPTPPRGKFPIAPWKIKILQGGKRNFFGRIK